MKKVFVVGAALVAVTSAAHARGPGGSFGGGASSFSPGHSFQSNGPVTGSTGASGYSPGHQMQSNGPVTGSPGASGYAPGKLKR
jgi:hypothetical protein